MALIYLVEDDASIREIEMIALKNSNYTVCAFENAKQFYERLEKEQPDLALLDLMLPDEDGYQIVRKIRKNPRTRNLPVMIVTAKSGEMDLVKGFDDGADDYIRKPFSVMELLSRVKALLRRTEETEKKLSSGRICMNHEKREVSVEQLRLSLTYKEYELLRMFLQNPGIVLARETIVGRIWGVEYEGESRTVDMHIKTLRQKLGEEGKRIRTVRNVGYVLHETGD